MFLLIWLSLYTRTCVSDDHLFLDLERLERPLELERPERTLELERPERPLELERPERPFELERFDFDRLRLLPDMLRDLLLDPDSPMSS